MSDKNEISVTIISQLFHNYFTTIYTQIIRKLYANWVRSFSESSEKVPRKFRESSEKVPRKFRESSEKVPRNIREDIPYLSLVSLSLSILFLFYFIFLFKNIHTFSKSFKDEFTKKRDKRQRDKYYIHYY